MNEGLPARCESKGEKQILRPPIKDPIFCEVLAAFRLIGTLQRLPPLVTPRMPCAI